MIICRGLRFRDEDDAYDYFRQREIDAEAEAARLAAPKPEAPCDNAPST